MAVTFSKVTIGESSVWPLYLENPHPHRTEKEQGVKWM